MHLIASPLSCFFLIGFVSILLLCLQPSSGHACLHLRGISLGSLASAPARISHYFVPIKDLMYLKSSVQIFLCCLQTFKKPHFREEFLSSSLPLSQSQIIIALRVQPGQLKVLYNCVFVEQVSLSIYACLHFSSFHQTMSLYALYQCET